MILPSEFSLKGENEAIGSKKIEMVEQMGRQLDLLKGNDSEAAAAVIKVLREQMISFGQVRHCSVCLGAQGLNRGTWWLSGGFGALRPEGSRFEFHSSRNVGILGKSLTRSCL